MKKTALVWVLALSMALFVGCGTNDDENVNAPVDQQQVQQQQTEDDAANGQETNGDVLQDADANNENNANVATEPTEQE